MCQSEGDGLVLARMVDELTNRVTELAAELATEKRTNALLQQANMAQSAELQRLRSKAMALP